MAAPGTQNVNVPVFSYETRQADIDRRMKLAQALQESGQAEQPEFSYRGIVAPTSPLSGLAKALQLGLGAYRESSAYEDQKALSQEMQDRRTADMSKFVEMLQGSTVPGTAAVLPNTPNASAGEPQQYPGADLYRPQPQNLGTPNRIIPGDSQAAFTALAASPLGDLQQMGVQGVIAEGNAKRVTAAELAKENRNAAAERVKAEIAHRYALELQDKKNKGKSNIVFPANQTAYQKKAGEAAQKQDMAEYSAMKNSPHTIRRNQQILDQLDKDVNTGIFANWKQDLDRLMGMWGNEKSASKATNTEILSSLIGQGAFEFMREYVVGSKNWDTPLEREFLLKVVNGDIIMTKETLKFLAENQINNAKIVTENWNNRPASEKNRFFAAHNFTDVSQQSQPEPSNPSTVTLNGENYDLSPEMVSELEDLSEEDKRAYLQYYIRQSGLNQDESQ